MRGLDNNEEAKNLVENFKGSTENIMRSLYNLGYWQGFNDGQREAVQMLERTLMDMTIAKDEPQTQLTARCLNCNNAKACKEKHWEGCIYEPKDEKTCETCRHWKYIAHEWQCEACKCQGYEPKDEPQTEREGE